MSMSTAGSDNDLATNTRTHAEDFKLEKLAQLSTECLHTCYECVSVCVFLFLNRQAILTGLTNNMLSMITHIV